MDCVFCKFVTCCNSVKKPHQGTTDGPFRAFILSVAASIATYVYAGDYIISCGIFLGAVVCVLLGVYKAVTAPPTSDLVRNTGDADDNIMAGTSDGSTKSSIVVSDAAICSGVQTGPSWWTRLTFRVRRWTNTFELDFSALGQPIGPVTEHIIFEGRPMKQRFKATCALVACTVAVEANNWFVFALLHSEDMLFPWVAAEPLELQKICLLRRIWNKDTGASVCHVLDLIREWGGVPLANPSDAQTVLPLTGWQEYTGPQLTQDLVAKLLLNGGPCVGTLWVCPWYHLFDTSRNSSWVYRGCGRSKDDEDITFLDTHNTLPLDI